MTAARTATLGAFVEAPEAACFHCGLAIRERSRKTIRYRERHEPHCCAGCEAVARTIITGGFDAYYAHRSAAATRVVPRAPAIIAVAMLYVRP